MSHSEYIPDPSEERASRSRKKPQGMDRVPPHDLGAEMGVAGCVLLNPSGCLDALDEMNFSHEWCYDLRLQTILGTARAMHYRTPRVPVDLITLSTELRQMGQLEEVGGVTFLSELQDQVPSAANLPRYVEIVREHWQRRLLILTCTEIVGQSYEADTEVSQLLAEAQGALLKAEQCIIPGTEQTLKRIIADKVISKLEGHYYRGKAQIRGVTTGLEYLDKLLGGMGQGLGNYYVIAARPNTGKTSIVTQIAMHALLDYGRWEACSEEDYEKVKAGGGSVTRTDDNKPLRHLKGISVGISSLEMKAETLVEKMLFQRSGADLQRWRTGFGLDSDLTLLTAAATDLCGSKHTIVIDDTPRLKIGQLKAKWRRWHRQYGVRLFILDYLQLMQSDSRKFRPQRNEELAEISAELQALGKELNCPMLILAQMNRNYETDPNRVPRLSDLKDSGALEQDADVVMFLYQPRMSDTNKEFYENAMEQVFGAKWRKWDGRPQRINVLVEKNRLGPKGKAELLLLHSSTVFVDWGKWCKENKVKAAAKGEESLYDGKEEEGES
jgi:replicative DNA helicase